MERLLEYAERGRLPDTLIRFGIRKLLKTRLEGLPSDVERIAGRRQTLMTSMLDSPIARSTDVANEQHYEIPAAIFERCLGPQKKYSCCYYDKGFETLPTAEMAMLDLTCKRADLQDGQQILELGCGWGSLSLWMAEHYPKSRILALSNSQSQREYIEHLRDQRGLKNLEVITVDMNDFHSESARFDRVVSVEMFEHMRNWQELLRRIATWLKPNGRFFMHIFCHRNQAYYFTQDKEDDWMGKYFFRDGLMPSADLPGFFQRDLRLLKQWHVNGRHYAKTCNAWLSRQDKHREELLPLFRQVYGEEAERWFQRWRIFYMACAELFAFNEGNEWFVTHVLYERRALEGEGVSSGTTSS